jgi:hypothetical protein
MFVSCTVFVLSGRGLCDRPIPRPEESYRLWCVSECDQVQVKTLYTCCEQVGRRQKDCENMPFIGETGNKCSLKTFCGILLIHKFQTWRRTEFLVWQLPDKRNIYHWALCTADVSCQSLYVMWSVKRKINLRNFVSKLLAGGSYLTNVADWNREYKVRLRYAGCALNYVIVHQWHWCTNNSIFQFLNSF